MSLRLRLPVSCHARLSAPSLAHHAIPVAVAHEAPGRVSAPHRGDAARASRQVMRPLPFVSQRRSASASPVRGASGGGAASLPPATIIAVEAHRYKTPSRALASRASTVSRYLRLTATTRAANQHRFSRGSHSPASFPLFRCRFTAGAANVSFSRSEANRRLVPASAAQSPLSWAYEVATMCSTSVSRRLAKCRPVYGPYTRPPMPATMRVSMDWG